MRKSHRLAGLILFAYAAGCLVAAPSGPADAGKKEPSAVTALLDAVSEEFGVRPTYRRARTADDGTITIRSLTTEPKDADPNAPQAGTTISVESLSLSGIKVLPNGLLDIATVRATNLILLSSEGETGSALRLPEATLTDVVLRPATPGSPSATPDAVDRASVGSFLALGAVLSSGGTSLPIGEVRLLARSNPATGSSHYALSLNDIHYPASAIGRSDPSGAVLALLGGDLVVDVALTGDTYAGGTDRQGAFNARLGIRSFGSFRLTGRYDAPHSDDVSTIGEGMRLSALAPFMQPIVLTDLMLRFEDQSGTRRLLAMLASDQKIEPTTLIANATDALQIGLADVGDKSVIDHVIAAVRTFLTEPKSLTIRSSPGQPVPMQVLLGSGSDPAQLVSKLPMSVTAND